MEKVVLATVKGLTEVVEKREETLVFRQGEKGTLVILGSDSGTESGGEGSRWGGGGEEPTHLGPELSDSEEEEEDEEEEDMVDQKLEWMTQGPLALLGDLHRMPKHSKRMLTKYDPDGIVNAEDHLGKFYLQLQTLVVRHYDVACGLFRCTCCATVWYHNLPVNSIHNWVMFKMMFLEFFFDDKTPAMLLKELGKSEDGVERESKMF